jgi:hypothetical protein
MRRKDEQQLDVFSYISPEQRVPQDHPLRLLRAMTDQASSDLPPGKDLALDTVQGKSHRLTLCVLLRRYDAERRGGTDKYQLDVRHGCLG